MVFIYYMFMFPLVTGYNYEILALQKCNDSSRYTIHGLWPTWNATSWPQFCDNSSVFNPDLLGEIVLNEMRRDWYSCPGYGNNTSFWSHEWSKHGTCSGLGQKQYFYMALNYYSNRSLWEECLVNKTSECEVAIFPHT